MLSRNWQATNLEPIFLGDIIVQGWLDVRRVQAVLAVLARTRNPVRPACLDLEVVRLEAATAQALERLALIVNGRARLGKGDPPDARGVGQSPLPSIRCT